jgi:hypothetical protein
MEPWLDQKTAAAERIKNDVICSGGIHGESPRIPGRFRTLSYSRTTGGETANEISPVNIALSTVWDAPRRDRSALSRTFASATIILYDIKCDIEAQTVQGAGSTIFRHLPRRRITPSSPARPSPAPPYTRPVSPSAAGCPARRPSPRTCLWSPAPPRTAAARSPRPCSEARSWP